MEWPVIVLQSEYRMVVWFSKSGLSLNGPFDNRKRPDIGHTLYIFFHIKSNFFQIKWSSKGKFENQNFVLKLTIPFLDHLKTGCKSCPVGPMVQILGHGFWLLTVIDYRTEMGPF
jgi:hypothetical protein